MARTTCLACEGRGFEECSACGGKGSAGGLFGVGAKMCIVCEGEGRVTCPVCAGEGTVEGVGPRPSAPPPIPADAAPPQPSAPPPPPPSMPPPPPEAPATAPVPAPRPTPVAPAPRPTPVAPAPRPTPVAPAPQTPQPSATPLSPGAGTGKGAASTPPFKEVHTRPFEDRRADLAQREKWKSAHTRPLDDAKGEQGQREKWKPAHTRPLDEAKGEQGQREKWKPASTRALPDREADREKWRPSHTRSLGDRRARPEETGGEPQPPPAPVAGGEPTPAPAPVEEVSFEDIVESQTVGESVDIASDAADTTMSDSTVDSAPAFIDAKTEPASPMHLGLGQDDGSEERGGDVDEPFGDEEGTLEAARSGTLASTSSDPTVDAVAKEDDRVTLPGVVHHDPEQTDSIPVLRVPAPADLGLRAPPGSTRAPGAAPVSGAGASGKPLSRAEQMPAPKGRPEPPPPAEPEPPTVVEAHPPTTEAEPEPPTVVEGQPPTEVEPEPPTVVEGQPPADEEPLHRASTVRGPGLFRKPGEEEPAPDAHVGHANAGATVDTTPEILAEGEPTFDEPRTDPSNLLGDVLPTDPGTSIEELTTDEGLEGATVDASFESPSRPEDPRGWLSRALELDGRAATEGAEIVPSGTDGEASKAFAAAREIFERLLSEGVGQHAEDLAYLCIDEASALGAEADPAHLASMLRRAADILDRLRADEGREGLDAEAADVLTSAARAAEDAAELADGATLFARAIAIREVLDGQGLPGHDGPLAEAHMSRASCLDQLGDHAAAADGYGAAAQLWQRRVDALDEEPLDDLARAYMNQGVAKEQLGDLPTAADLYQKAIALWEPLLAQDEAQDLAGDLGWTMAYRAGVLDLLGDADTARASARRAVEILAAEVRRTKRADLEDVLGWARTELVHLLQED